MSASVTRSDLGASARTHLVMVHERVSVLCSAQTSASRRGNKHTHSRVIRVHTSRWTVLSPARGHVTEETLSELDAEGRVSQVKERSWGRIQGEERDGVL